MVNWSAWSLSINDAKGISFLTLAPKASNLTIFKFSASTVFLDIKFLENGPLNIRSLAGDNLLPLTQCRRLSIVCHVLFFLERLNLKASCLPYAHPHKFEAHCQESRQQQLVTFQ
jgi:hypothetical protein